MTADRRDSRRGRGRRADVTGDAAEVTGAGLAAAGAAVAEVTADVTGAGWPRPPEPAAADGRGDRAVTGVTAEAGVTADVAEAAGRPEPRAEPLRPR